MKNPGQDKKTMLAMILMMLVVFGWIYLTGPKTTSQPVKAPELKTEPQKSPDLKNPEPTKTPSPQKVAKKDAMAVKEIPEEVKSFDQDLYKVEFSNHGAIIKSLTLKKYRKALAKNSGPYEMFTIEEDDAIPFLWSLGVGKEIYGTRIPFQIAAIDAKGISFKADLPFANLLISYDLSKNDYLIGYNLEVESKLGEDVDLSAFFKLFGRTHNIIGSSGMFGKQEEPVKTIYNLNDKTIRDLPQTDAAKLEPFAGDIKWLGFNEKYFMTVLLPEAPSVKSFSYVDERDTISFYKGDDLVESGNIVRAQGNMLEVPPATLKSIASKGFNLADLSYKVERGEKLIFEGRSPTLIEQASGCMGKTQSLVIDNSQGIKLVDDLFAAKVNYPQRKLKAGQKLAYAGTLYIGPKEIPILNKMGKSMDKAIDLGDWLGPIARPLLYFLKWLYSIIPNYGIAIIILTLFVRAILYPLQAMQNKSMKKMQLLKPEMDKLKEKYKNDKEALNREMMKIWKIHKVNPMGGCFPILLQLPIFFALYRVLYNSIELRHAPFMLWIKDLSDYDPYFVTPILMGLSWYLQQKFMPQTGADPAQQKMMNVMMPIMFTVFMLFLPAGLVLYIFVSTILGIAQQWYGMRDVKTSPSIVMQAKK